MITVIVGTLVWVMLWRFFAERGSNSPTGAPSVGVPLLFSLILWLVVGNVALYWLVRTLQGTAIAAVAAALTLVLLFPWPISTWLLIPLGLPRAAYYVTHLCTVRFHPDRRGGALLAASLALQRARAQAAPDAREFIEKRLAGLPTLRGAGVVAAGLLAGSRGDLDGARALLTSIDTMDRSMLPPAAIAVARTWRCADAAARGDWALVARFGRVPGPSSSVLSFLAACARCFVLPTGSSAGLGPGSEHAVEPAEATPSTLALWLDWLFTPHRSETYPLLRRALVSTPREAAPYEPAGPTEKAAESGDGLLARALTELSRLLITQSAPGRRTELPLLLRVARAWDRALDDEGLKRRVRERGLVVGTLDPAATLATLRTQVVAALAARVRAARIRLSLVLTPPPELGPASPILGAAARVVRDEMLADLELVCDALRRRLDDKRALPLLDEWREWAELRARYERAVHAGGRELRRLAWPKWNRDLCSLAVWLWNERSKTAPSCKTLANTIFRALLEEAEALGDERTADLQRKNVACGP